MMPIDWSNVQNILVMRLDNLGDVVMTGPALRALKAALPEAKLTLMASPGGAKAATLLPWVDEVLVWRAIWQDLGHLPFDPARERALVETLRDGRYDAAIIFTSFSQTPYGAAFACLLADIPLRIGEAKEKAAGVLTHQPAAAPDEIHQVDRNLRLLEATGIPIVHRDLSIQIPADAYHTIAEKLWTHGLSPGTPYLVLAPWASCQARSYFPDRFAQAARQLAEETGLRTVLVGADKERPRTGALTEILGPSTIDLTGETTVPELAALIAGAQLVLCNNSLPLHLSDATRTPGIILYSGTEYESQWAPRYTPHRLLRRATDCSPCYAFTCPYNQECLDIPPQELVEAGQSLLATAAMGQ